MQAHGASIAACSLQADARGSSSKTGLDTSGGPDMKGKEWLLLIQHDMAQHHRAEAEKSQAAAQRRLEVSAFQRQQAEEKRKMEAIARQQSLEGWRKCLHENQVAMDKRDNAQRQRQVQLDEHQKREATAEQRRTQEVDLALDKRRAKEEAKRVEFKRQQEFLAEQAAQADAREQEKQHRRQKLQRECVDSVQHQLAEKAEAGRRLREEERRILDCAQRQEAAAAAKDAAKASEKKQRALRMADEWKAQIDQHAQERRGEGGRMSTPERKFNKTRLRTALDEHQCMSVKQ